MTVDDMAELGAMPKLPSFGALAPLEGEAPAAPTAPVPAPVPARSAPKKVRRRAKKVRRRGALKNLKRLLRAAGIALLVVLVGIGGLLAWSYSAAKPATDASNQFLDVVNAGDYRAAAAQVAPECQRDLNDGRLAEIFDGAQFTHYLGSTRISYSSSVEGQDAKVTGTISAPRSVFDEIELTLNNRSGEWRVCSFAMTDADSLRRLDS